VPEHAFFKKAGPWAIAHRGGRGLWPENTLVAFENAAALGVDVLEMDLRVTSDGVFVVIHDRSVDRTTNGSGRVDSMTFAELRKLDAGYRFSAGAERGFPYRGKAIVVPTFDEVLARFPSASLNVEMKDFNATQAARLCEVIRGVNVTEHVLVASAGHDAMAAFRATCPSVATSVTAREGFTLYVLYRLGLTSLYRGPATAIQMPESLGRGPTVEAGLVRLANEINAPVQVWTVNQEADMRRLLDLGVHGIMSDFPDRLLRVLNRLDTGSIRNSDSAEVSPERPGTR
jgi:glycerophosphoryl diester phosphodiesterase